MRVKTPFIIYLMKKLTGLEYNSADTYILELANYLYSEDCCFPIYIKADFYL